MCRVLKVSESGYYHSLSHDCEPKPWQLLPVKIKQVYAQHPDNDNYEVDRVQPALEQNGITASFQQLDGSGHRGSESRKLDST